MFSDVMLFFQFHTPILHADNDSFHSPTTQHQTPAGFSRPKHPNFASEQSRVQSFVGAQVPRGQSVDVLARAGFFHVGQ